MSPQMPYWGGTFDMYVELDEEYREWYEKYKNEEVPEEKPHCHHMWQKEYIIGQFFILRCTYCEEVKDD